MSERIPPIPPIRPKDYDPTTALEALVHDNEPPSRLDVARAARDGYRLRVRRRVVRTLSGVTAAGAVAAVAVFVPLHANGTATGPADRNTRPAPTAGPSDAAGSAPTSSITVPETDCSPLVGLMPPPAGSDYTMQIPAEFGWLPQSVPDDISQGPVNYLGDMPQAADAYSAAAGSSSGTGPQIKLFMFTNATGVPGLYVPGPGCGGMFGAVTAQGGGVFGDTFNGTTYLRPGPSIAGRPSYWISLDPAADFTGGTAVFAFETAGGHWAVLDATGLRSAGVEADLAHVASSLTVGPMALPSPIQIGGVPKSLGLQAAQSTMNPQTDGDGRAAALADIGISFGSDGPGSGIVHVDFWVFPVGQAPATFDGDDVCENANGLTICAVDDDGLVSDHVPGGLHYLLAHVVSLGANPAKWSPNLVVGSK